MMSRRLLFVALLGILTACQSALPPVSPAVLLSGRLTVPGFRTLATGAEIVSRAGIALIDGNGHTRAGGVTDDHGAFTLYQSDPPFTPPDGAFYTLEALKRLSNGGMVTLRTTVKRQGAGWTSITGSTVVITPATTAVALVDAADGAVTPADTLATVGGPAFDTPAAFGTYSAATLTNRVHQVTAQLADGFDPADGTPLTYTGDLTANNDATKLALKPYTTFTGNLFIGGTATTLSLPRLRTVSGYLIVNVSGLTSLSLPALQSVGGEFRVQGTAVTALDTLGALATVGGQVRILANGALTSLAGLHALTSVGTHLLISGNGALTQLGLTSLRQVPGAFTVSTNAQLPTIQATDLRAQLTAPQPTTTTITGNAP